MMTVLGLAMAPNHHHEEDANGQHQRTGHQTYDHPTIPDAATCRAIHGPRGLERGSPVEARPQEGRARDWQVERCRARDTQAGARRCRGLEGVKSQSEKAGDPGTTRDSVDTQEFDSRPVPSYHYQTNTVYSTTTMATLPVALPRWGDGFSIL